MNRRELIDAVANEAEVDKKTADAVVRAFQDVIFATVAKGDPVTISGFVKFAKVKTNARMGRNPATGEAIKIPARTKARITPLKGFKDVALGTVKPPKLKK